MLSIELVYFGTTRVALFSHQDLLLSAKMKPLGYYLDHFWQADLGCIGQAIIGVKVPNSSHVASIQHWRVPDYLQSGGGWNNDNGGCGNGGCGGNQASGSGVQPPRQQNNGCSGNIKDPSFWNFHIRGNQQNHLQLSIYWLKYPGKIIIQLPHCFGWVQAVDAGEEGEATTVVVGETTATTTPPLPTLLTITTITTSLSSNNRDQPTTISSNNSRDLTTTTISKTTREHLQTTTILQLTSKSDPT